MREKSKTKCLESSHPYPTAVTNSTESLTSLQHWVGGNVCVRVCVRCVHVLVHVNVSTSLLACACGEQKTDNPGCCASPLLSLLLFIGQASWLVRFHGFSYLCFPPSFTWALGIWTLDPVLARRVFYPNKPCFFSTGQRWRLLRVALCETTAVGYDSLIVDNTAAARKVGRGAGEPTKGRNHEAAPMDSFLDDFKAR